jgi:glyoxalase family protein
LRLVKKTVNFDNHNVYHFYYGNERGEPGTIWTTFPYRGWGVPQGIHGKGQITVTSFSVREDAMDWWQGQLDRQELAFTALSSPWGEPVLELRDPSGLVFHLIGTREDHRTPWAGSGIAAAHAIRGLHSVTMLVRTASRSVDFLTGVLGWRVVGQEDRTTRLAAGGEGAGHLVEVVQAPEATVALNGLGTVHHVAMAIGGDEEPGGILLEVATIAPGFTVDEPLATLGRGLKLPPWEEPARRAIEAGLPAVAYA